MVIIRAWEIEGVEVPEPYRRRIKVLLAPDQGGVSILSMSQAIIPPQSKTDYHSHDRPEAIYVVSGSGVCMWEGQKIPITSGMVFWVPPGERHQFINTGYEPLTLVTVFVPPYTAAENYAKCLQGWGTLDSR
jgi:mannose-6-phosphate isomerase-like protein (cupin superfamily)